MDINNFQNYRIKRETMTLIADKLRVLVGKTTPLTPSDIAYYLERVIFTPQSYANSEFSLSLTSSASCVLPDVSAGSATSEFSLSLTSSAIGTLQED